MARDDELVELRMVARLKRFGSRDISGCTSFRLPGYPSTNREDHIYDAKFYPYAAAEDDGLVAFTCSTDKSKEELQDNSKKKIKNGSVNNAEPEPADQVRLILVYRIVEDTNGAVDFDFVSRWEDKTEFDSSAKVSSSLGRTAGRKAKS
jgi:hypothetical protein